MGCLQQTVPSSLVSLWQFFIFNQVLLSQTDFSCVVSYCDILGLFWKWYSIKRQKIIVSTYLVNKSPLLEPNSKKTNNTDMHTTPYPHLGVVLVTLVTHLIHNYRQRRLHTQLSCLCAPVSSASEKYDISLQWIGFIWLVALRRDFYLFFNLLQDVLCAFPLSMFSSVTSLSAAAHGKRYDKKTSGSQLTCNVQIDGVTWRSQIL